MIGGMIVLRSSKIDVDVVSNLETYIAHPVGINLFTTMPRISFHPNHTHAGNDSD